MNTIKYVDYEFANLIIISSDKTEEELTPIIDSIWANAYPWDWEDVCTALKINNHIHIYHIVDFSDYTQYP